MPKEKQAAPTGDICFSGHINEQSACEAGKSAKAQDCELKSMIGERRNAIMNEVHDIVWYLYYTKEKVLLYCQCTILFNYFTCKIKHLNLIYRWGYRWES
ncbi:MAG: hypothetical protein ACI4DU_02870 [Lachnospiraceae bacterium]